MKTYFTLDELTRSTTALANKIDNTPPADAIINLTRLRVNLLDKVRERYGAPIYINSGYRSKTLNKLVKGATNSQHLYGEAADITTRNTVNNKKLFDLIKSMQAKGEIEFDQLIDEQKYTWLHVSLKGKNNRNQILHLL